MALVWGHGVGTLIGIRIEKGVLAFELSFHCSCNARGERKRATHKIYFVDFCGQVDSIFLVTFLSIPWVKNWRLIKSEVLEAILSNSGDAPRKCWTATQMSPFAKARLGEEMQIRSSIKQISKELNSLHKFLKEASQRNVGIVIYRMFGSKARGSTVDWTTSWCRREAGIAEVTQITWFAWASMAEVTSITWLAEADIAHVIQSAQFAC